MPWIDRDVAASSSARTAEIDLVDWRRRVFELYATVRHESSPAAAHGLWRAGRDRLFREHPQSPLPAGDRFRDTGLPYWPYDASLRFELPLLPEPSSAQVNVTSAADGAARMRSIGAVEIPTPVDARIEVWWLEQYGGGVFVPLRDGTAGELTYGGGRYLLDTAKGADLGSRDGCLIIDLNFLYHASCRYDSAWQCPLAPPENRVTAAIQAGERLHPA
jgi:uncharacterized protein